MHTSLVQCKCDSINTYMYESKTCYSTVNCTHTHRSTYTVDVRVLVMRL